MTKKAKQHTRGEPIDLVAACRAGLLPGLLETYLLSCGAEGPGETEDKPSGKRKFPNVAGFCRFCGIGQADLAALKEACPHEYDALFSVLEDEALNADYPAAVLTTYLKSRLGYGERKAESAGTEGEAPIPVFEHDILADGE